MDYEVFIEKMKQLQSASTSEQRHFYKKVLRQEKEKTRVAFAAKFYIGVSYYYDGEFEKARGVLEPIVIDYHSYEYVHEIISGFNLMGIIAHYEREFILSRYYYMVALKIAKMHENVYRYSYEYNNISLTYIAQKDFENALENILLAEKYLSESDGDMGAYVYLNMSEIYFNLNENEKAIQAFYLGKNTYCGHKIIPIDYLNVGILLFHKVKNEKKYEEYKNRALASIDQMHATEYIDCCKALFLCGMESDDYGLILQILNRLNLYLAHHPQEIKVAMMIEEYKYNYAKKIHNKEGMLRALERKNMYFENIVDESQKRRIQDLDTYFLINKKMQDAKETAFKANQVKTQFLSNMSHDMRTPINGIMGMLQMIQKNKDDEKKMDDCLMKINASSQHLLSLVNDVLDMNKLESNSMTLEYEPFNLDEVCKQVDQIVSDQASREGIHVYQMHGDVTSINLIGSATSLKKILINLFTNAIKYNKPNGSIYTSLVELSRTEKKVTYEFKIRDTGIGMSQEFIQNNLYEPFIQASNVARSKYDGTGLGMSIVKGLVDQMHGTIEVDSKMNEGTCFTVILTFDLDLMPAQKVQKPKIKNSLEEKKILVVEDNDLNMEVARFFLEEFHVDLYMAKNGLEAIDIVEKQDIDLILMDLMMPIMNGYETTKRIRQAGYTLPIIAMSANVYNEDIKKCLDVGMNAHLSKPIHKDTLYEMLIKYLNEKE